MFSSSILTVCLLLCNTVVQASIPSLSGYHVVWSDDFNGAQGTGVDTSKWNQIAKHPTANGEQETYTSGTGNVHLSGDGQLYIIPTKDSSGNWLSGRIESNAAFTAPTGGAMVIQAELWVPDFAGNPATRAGLWPAFWTLGNRLRSSGCAWPKCGEWDIFEVTPWLENHNVASLHYQLNDGTKVTLNDANHHAAYSGGQYHTWAVKVDLRNSDWTQQTLSFWLDGTQYYSVSGSQIGDQGLWSTLAWWDYYVIFNVAVGGGYPGNPGSQTVAGYDSSMRVRYVAVYQTN
ncbi:Glycoside hydrolase family 16 protein [Mycena indigotica]|uniref:Glycoside hydrolase family 16 protein n=1 Tax=Mycena indigotica TaxID=2126181 RepID=A0A8H6S3R9_9AGAR|nr:Glycoside hydrolase family 16 protein [Mycena indigotica]KAF7291877.1 Glycoside hydrolase family 16 protein [Mycena indigotica]